MRHLLLKLVVVILCITSCQPKPKELTTASTSPFSTTLVIGKRDTITSKVLNEERPIIISLPKDYNKNNANYPVLYLTDGQQNIQHAMGTIEVLTRTGSMPPVIVVGIESIDRGRDFTPTKNENSPNSGNGPSYLKFIESELIPYIESSYRTHPFRILEGHSMGGLFAAYTLMEKPELFDAHIIMSPSLWWNNEESTERAKAFFKEQPNLKSAIFFGIGTMESSKEWGMRKELTSFIEAIKVNQPKNLRFEHRELEGEGHMSSPLLSNYYGLKFIFSDMALPSALVNDFNEDIFLKHEQHIMTKYGSQAKQSAEAYVNLVFRLINKEQFKDAITVIQRSIEAYDYDIWLRNLLASTYEKNNQITEAIEAYKAAIDVSKKYKFGKEAEFQGHIDRLIKIE